MQLLTIMQFICILGIYLFLAVLFPALVFYRKFKAEPFYVRFMVYITLGNFFIINLVFVLQLLKISNKFTLLAGTAAFFLFALKKVYRIKPLDSIKNIAVSVIRLLRGTMGIRLLLKRTRWYFLSVIKRLLKRMALSIKHSWTEWFFTIIVICLVLWIYGTNMVTAFGYSASDIPVHNYWINEMDKNNIFAAGIYPFGFHCVIYYIHTVFSVKTYILLRVFGVVQTLFIHLVLLAFIRACCKSRYIPYAVTAVYIFISLFNSITYSRYISPLPQEFGMVFILPPVYFLYRFFEARRREILLKQSVMAGSTDIEEIRKKYSYNDIKGKIVVEIEIYEPENSYNNPGNKEYPEGLTKDATYKEDSIIILESEGIDGRLVNESLEVCGEVKETYKIYQNNAQAGQLFEEIASSMKKAEEYRPWESVLDGTGTDNKNDSIKNLADVSSKDNKNNITSKNSGSPGNIKEKLPFIIKNYFLRIWSVFKRKPGKLWNIESNLYLVLFALCFSMTLAIHFYDTMIAGIFCIGIAAGYCFRLFKKEYFMHVMLTGILSIVIAVFPMAVSFAGGKPLQGSLGWGMEIILGNRGSGSSIKAKNESTGNSKNSNQGNTTEEGTGNGSNAGDEGIKIKNTARKPFIIKRAFNKLRQVHIYSMERFKEYIFTDTTNIQRKFVFVIIWSCILSGLLLFIRKDKDYAARVFSTGVCIILLFMVLISKDIGIPAIMDRSRISIYISYMLPVSAGMAADAVIVLILGRICGKKVINGVSMAASMLLAALAVYKGYIKEPVRVTNFQTFESNDAITCLTNIMNENKDKTYTICSANDELRMVEGYGYHYETINFLREMEGDNYKDNLTIPTNKVYFFIEKKPVGYASSYEGDGQYISAEGASNPLVYSSGLGIYQGKNRWIVMSRMYYWAKEFQKMYSKEMKVYYESKDFVCYVAEQNPYRLYDFSIDYWYNTRTWDYKA